MISITQLLAYICLLLFMLLRHSFSERSIHEQQQKQRRESNTYVEHLESHARVVGGGEDNWFVHVGPITKNINLLDCQTFSLRVFDEAESVGVFSDFVADSWFVPGQAYCMDAELAHCNTLTNSMVYSKNERRWKCVPKAPSVFDRRGNILKQVCGGSGQIYYDLHNKKSIEIKDRVDPLQVALSMQQLDEFFTLTLEARNDLFTQSQLFSCRQPFDFKDERGNVKIPRFITTTTTRQFNPRLYYMDNYCTCLLSDLPASEEIQPNFATGQCENNSEIKHLTRQLYNKKELPFTDCTGLDYFAGSTSGENQGSALGLSISRPCYTQSTPLSLREIIKTPCYSADNKSHCQRAVFLATNTYTPLAWDMLRE